MKFTPEVITALATLRAAAENDFECHRIDVLERDLTAPPNVEIIDDIHQRFNGVTYCERKKDNHYTTGMPLHRAVWTYWNGNIPADYEIHHVDHNPKNNAIENLQCLSPSEHKRLHNLEMKSHEYTCEICGKKFFSSRIDYQNIRYCSKKCNARAFKQNHMETRTCIYCGKEFSAPATNNTRFCSKACQNNYLWNNEWKNRRLKAKICPICEQEFIPRGGKQIYCSKSCRNIALARRVKELSQEKQAQKQRTCPACGEKFFASHKEQYFCSQSCAAKFQHSKKQKLEEKTCPICGKTFMPQKRKNIYCSNICATQARAQNRPEKEHRTCPICGKEFTPKYPSSSQICCSRECGNKLTAEKNKSRHIKKQKICPICRKTFMPRNSKQVYCSHMCASKHYSQEYRKSDAEKQRICPVCGKSFIPSHSSVTCCSRSCGAKISAQKNRKASVKKICPVCGKEFTLKYSTSKQVYCSRACAHK